MLVTRRRAVVGALVGLTIGGLVAFESARTVERVDLSSIYPLPDGTLVVESFQTEGGGGGGDFRSAYLIIRPRDGTKAQVAGDLRSHFERKHYQFSGAPDAEVLMGHGKYLVEIAGAIDLLDDRDRDFALERHLNELESEQLSELLVLVLSPR